MHLTIISKAMDQADLEAKTCAALVAFDARKFQQRFQARKNLQTSFAQKNIQFSLVQENP